MTQQSATTDSSYRGQESSTNEVEYENIDIKQTNGFKPALVISAVGILVYILVGGGLPIYWVVGEGEFTLLSYTAPIASAIVVFLSFCYEYWVEKKENLTEGPDR